MDERVRSAARSAEQSTPFRWLARGGYVAIGLVHLLIGVLALLAAANHGAQDADQAHALVAVAGVPFGFIALWAIAALLLALGLFHLVHGFALRIDSARRRWGRRLAEWGQGLAFVVMSGIATAVAVGARPDPDESAQDASRGLLTLPGGPLILGVAGVGIGVAGIVWIVMGVRRSFEKQLALPGGKRGRLIAAVGAIGFVAKGVALVAVGGLLVTAAVRRDAETAGALDAAVEALRVLPFGEWLVVLIALGFIAYGLFCFLRARYADLSGSGLGSGSGTGSGSGSGSDVRI